MESGELYTYDGIYASRVYGYECEVEYFDEDLYLRNSRMLALAQRAFDMKVSCLVERKTTWGWSY